MKIAEIKDTAKKTLRGKYVNAFGLVAVFTVINFAIKFVQEETLAKNTTTGNIISIIFGIIKIFLSFGLIANLIKLSKQTEKIPYTELINTAVLNAPNILKIFIRMFLYLLIPSIICSIALFLGNIIAIKIPNFTTIFSIISVLIVFAIIFYISLNYAFALFCLADDNKASSKDILDKSKELMKNNKLKYVLLCLSFIGYYIAILLINIILTFFVTNFILNVITTILVMLLTPYITISLYIFYEEIINEKQVNS